MITVKEVIALYLKNLVARVADDDYAASGLVTARAFLAQFEAAYGNQTIAECKQHDMSDFLTNHPEWAATTTKCGAVSAVTACMNWALDEELIERSPYRRPRILRGKQKNIRRPATQEEVVKLMRWGGRPLRRAIYFLIKTGTRTCEMRDLTWDEVHLDGPVPYLSLSRHKTFRMTGKPRQIGLDPSTARFLRNLGIQYERRCNCNCPVCQDNISPNVFTNSRGTPWDRHTFARHFRRTAKAIGLDECLGNRVSAYCLRHLFTVNAIEAGVPTRSIADQLGHAGTAMIDSHYGSHTKHRVEHLSNVAEQINRQRNRQGKKG